MVVIGQSVKYGNDCSRTYFSTLKGAQRYRDLIIGTDNIGATDGIWSIQVIGPAATPAGDLILADVETWQFVGEWADNGNDYVVTGLKRKLV